MKKKILLISFVLISILLMAEVDKKAGEYGFQMLKISPSPVSAALGNTGAFSEANAFSFIIDPTAPVINRKQMVSFAQNYWLFDTTMNNLAYVNSNGKFGFGAAFRYLDYGEVNSYDQQANYIGDFYPLDVSFTTNFSFRLNPSHYFGSNINFLYEELDSASSTGIAFDLGYTYLTPIRDLKLHAAIKYLGSTSKMNEEKLDLPSTQEIGVTKDCEFSTIDLHFEGRIIKHIDDESFKSTTGLEMVFREKLALRLGYKMNYDLESFTTGFGIKLRKINIDYAYVPVKEDLDAVHMLSLSYLFK